MEATLPIYIMFVTCFLDLNVFSHNGSFKSLNLFSFKQVALLHVLIFATTMKTQRSTIAECKMIEN